MAEELEDCADGVEARMAASAQHATMRFIEGCLSTAGHDVNVSPFFSGVFYGYLQALYNALDNNITLDEFRGSVVAMLDDFIAQERKGMN
jgi:hypothetical protein